MDRDTSSLDLIRRACQRLDRSDAPHLDARWILAKVLDVDHRDASLHRDQELTSGQVARFEEMVRRRASGEPLAYILGEWEFFGHAIEVTPAVLIPRPETELLVEWSLELLAGVVDPRVAEVGVGSGAVVVSLALAREDLCALAVDISAAALEVAESNLRRHRLLDRVDLVQGNLLEPVVGPFHLIISNPTYIVAGDPQLEENVARHEPQGALIDDVGGDGLGFHRALIDGFGDTVTDEGSLLMECGQGQTEAIEEYARSHGFETTTRKDLAGIPRAVRVSGAKDGAGNHSSGL